uniref:Uncharacterized protein n=1 Tax=Megaselia scalaris TaxID=36166 RepID=T1GA05_MEGSC
MQLPKRYNRADICYIVSHKTCLPKKYPLQFQSDLVVRNEDGLSWWRTMESVLTYQTGKEKWKIEAPREKL